MSKRSADSSEAKDTIIDIGKNKRVTVRKFKRANLVDIREFYEAEGELKPGKKGISLTEDQWITIVENIDAINDALVALGGGNTTKKAKTDDDIKEGESSGASKSSEEPSKDEEED